MKKLSNKVAVVTGGNSGIGLAAAREFKAEGAQVIINARNAERLAQTQTELGDEFDILQADVQKIDELAGFFQQVGEKYGKIDVLYLNAGIAWFAPIEQADEAFFDAQFNTNVKGVFFSVQKALPYLSEGASVIITSSIAGQTGMPNGHVYGATKAAVTSLAKSLSAELVGRKIRVNAISPGPIETPIFSKMGLPEEAIQEMAGGILQQVPMGRFGTSEEVAKLALFLASDDSAYIIGTDIEVDGGMATL